MIKKFIGEIKKQKKEKDVCKNSYCLVILKKKKKVEYFFLK